MNIHDRRSLELHRAAVRRLREDPIRLQRARQRVAAWRAGKSPPHYAERWKEILDRPLPRILAFMVEESDLAQELRSCSPFAGILTPQERWAILKKINDPRDDESPTTGALDSSRRRDRR